MNASKGRRLFAGLLVAAVAVAAFQVWRSSRAAALPPGLAWGNGRLEATEVDVTAKVAGRLASVKVQEGDAVGLGQVLALLDADDLQARLRAARAQAQQARSAVDEAQAGMMGAGSQRDLAESNLKRSQGLVDKGFIAPSRLDGDRSAVRSARAAEDAARNRIGEAMSAMGAAQAQVDVVRVALDDAQLKAPVAGRVLYRLAQPGEVVAAGGKVLTLLDMSDVYLSIYLPAAEAGKLVIGDAAQIVLDALPEQAIPARVVFVSPQAQFTPKEVETRSEREKLMFRVKLKVEADWLQQHADLAKPGMPGVGYVRTEAGVSWPSLPAKR